MEKVPTLPRRMAPIAVPGITTPAAVKEIIVPVIPDQVTESKPQRHDIRAKARYREESLLLAEISEIEYNLLSTQEIDDIAVVNVSKKEDYGPDTVRDLRMGPHNNSQICSTCSNDLRGCRGHNGKIVIPPLMHPMCIPAIIAVLSSVCNCCGCLLTTRDELDERGILKLRGDKRLAAIKELVKENKKRCSNAGCKPNPIYESLASNKDDYRLHFKWSDDKDAQSDTIPPGEPPGAPPDFQSIYKILNAIEPDDAELLGFAGLSHPRNMIIERVVVLPYTNRPDLVDGEKFQPDDFTYIYKDIVVKTAKYFDAKTEADADAAIKEIFFIVTRLMINDGKYFAGQRRVLSDLVKRIQGKSGVVRNNIMGKRVNFAGRSVIGPGHELRVDQIGIPREMAKKLTRPIKVNGGNRADLQSLMDQREIRYIEMCSGKYKGVRRAVNDNFRMLYPTYQLQLGDIVERPLRNGDFVIGNRQPTLGGQNLLVGKAVIIDDRVVRINLSWTTPQNADFDGDEINVHVPQTIESYVEAEQLLEISRNLMAPQRSVPLIGLVQDAMSAAYVITKMTPSISKEVYDYCIEMLGDAPQLKTLDERLKVHGVDKYSGLGLISAAFPEDFDYNRKFIGKKDVVNEVVVVDGIMTSGWLDGDVIGRKDSSVIHEMYKQMGGMITVDWLSDMQFLANAFLQHRGLSVGLDDCVPESEDFYRKIDSIMAAATQKAISIAKEPKSQNPFVEIEREQRILRVLEEAKKATEKPVLDFFQPDNGNIIMAVSGAKGSVLNAVQMAAVLGQQKVSAKRIERILPGDRILPIVRTHDPHPAAGGMCYGSLGTGLTPLEFFVYSQNNREALTDTAINTSQTGFLQHQIIKSAEDIVTMPDGSVRSADDTIIQPVYGGDGAAADELMKVKIHGETVHMFRAFEIIAEKINRKYA